MRLRVGGLVPLSTQDWPGQLAAVVFCQGCPWRCPYCHNPHLQQVHHCGEGEGMPWEQVLEFLRRRRGLLDGVVFSGGEPTAQTALPEALQAVRGLGYRTALHTAGAYPERLERILSLVDWVGFDVKAPFRHYERVTRVRGSGDDARASLHHLLESRVAHEVRITLHTGLLPEDAVMEAGCELAAMGVERLVIQEFRAAGCADPRFAAMHERSAFLRPSLSSVLRGMFPAFAVRAA